MSVPTLAGQDADKNAVRLHGVGSGRFEVVAEPGGDGVRLGDLALAAWDEWIGPLGLPSRLPVAITVRLVPEERWGFGADEARVEVEQAGVVSVWIRGGGLPGVARERRWLTALAEGALRRKAILSGIEPGQIRAPGWLASAAAEAMLVAERPSMLDAWQVEAGRGSAGETPSLREILLPVGPLSSELAEARRLAAFGVWLWLREESGRSGAWDRFVAALVAGESPGSALAREYRRLTPRADDAREWELSWRVARARLLRARTTPVMNAEESRSWIERTSRIVAADLRTGEERVMPACGDWATRNEAWLLAQRAERARLLEVNLARLHPFYRNAAGSLGRAWTALSRGKEGPWRQAREEWSEDMEAGRVLEKASRELLDAAEADLRAKGEKRS